MPTHEDDQSVFNEPHRRPDLKPPDPSEKRAEHTLSRKQPKEDAGRDALGVYDEPDIFPGRGAEVIDQDWSCDHCGYNLRGLPNGHPCPECGQKALYRPAAADATSYHNWLRHRIETISPFKAWMVAVAVALVGGPWAVLTAFLHVGPGMGGAAGMIPMVAIFGPVLEETMKIGLVACVIELRPYLFRRVEQLQLAAVGSALTFAVIENFLYLEVYVPNHTLQLALWRWTVCVALHVGCTLVASGGLVKVWQRAVTECRPPRLSLGLRPLVVAIVIHACYNAGAVLFEYVA